MKEPSLDDLDQAQRLMLLRFVCSFAWADMEVPTEEKDYVARLIGRLELEDAEHEQVEEWLEAPPEPEEVDPAEVPVVHREIFLDSIRGLIAADLDISDEERDSLELLEQLLQ